MKKSILKALLVMACVSSGTYAYATVTITSAGSTVGSQSYKPSNNVTVTVASVAGTSTDPGGYVALSYHGSGDREFGTGSTEPKMYWHAKPSTPTTTLSYTAGVLVPDVTGWTSL